MLLRCNSSLSDISGETQSSIDDIEKNNLTLSDSRALLLLSVLTFRDNAQVIPELDQIFTMTSPGNQVFEEQLTNFGDMRVFYMQETDLSSTTSPFNESVITSPIFGHFFLDSTAPSFGFWADTEPNKTASTLWVAGLLARIPAALVASLDTSGLLKQREIKSQKLIPGTTSTLDVEWLNVWIIFGILISLQIALVVSTLVYCRDVVVKENSIVAYGLALRNVTEELSYNVGSMASSREISRSFGEKKFKYGTTTSAWDGSYLADIRREEEVKSEFPDGVYV